MNQRFLIMIFAVSTVTFAAVWAATAPGQRAVAPAATEAPAVMYADCAAVRAANAAPLHVTEPGYRPALDANMNGIACEAVGAPVPEPTSDPAAPADTTIAPDAPVSPSPTPEQINPPPPGAGSQDLPVLT